LAAAPASAPTVRSAAIPAYDAVVQGMAGLNERQMASPMARRCASAFPWSISPRDDATIAILMAVIERARSGKGQFVEATLYDSAIALLHPHFAISSSAAARRCAPVTRIRM